MQGIVGCPIAQQVVNELSHCVAASILNTPSPAAPTVTHSCSGLHHGHYKENDYEDLQHLDAQMMCGLHCIEKPLRSHSQRFPWSPLGPAPIRGGGPMAISGISRG